MAQEVQNGSDSAATAAPPQVPAAVAFSAFKPQLTVEAPKAADAVQFYKAAFGAEEIGRETHPKRKADQELPLLLSADLKLGSAVFSVSDLVEGSVAQPNTGCVFVLQTEDLEAAIAKAIGAGAAAEAEVAEVEGGVRTGKVKDPYGFVWVISSLAKKSSDVVVEV